MHPNPIFYLTKINAIAGTEMPIQTLKRNYVSSSKHIAHVSRDSLLSRTTNTRFVLIRRNGLCRFQCRSSMRLCRGGFFHSLETIGIQYRQQTDSFSTLHGKIRVQVLDETLAQVCTTTDNVQQLRFWKLQQQTERVRFGNLNRKKEDVRKGPRNDRH